MEGELQQLVDSLGRRLRRAVSIHDPRLRLIVHGPQIGPVDPMRVESILRRETPPDTVAYVMSLGIDTASGPVRVPPRLTAMSQFGRVCIPLRVHGLLLGYLWLIEGVPPMSEQELAIAAATADAAGAILYRQRLRSELERGRERELVRDLLTEAEDVRKRAQEQLFEERLFAQAAGVVVLVLVPGLPKGEADESMGVSIELALDLCRRVMSPRRSLHLARPDHGVFIADGNDSTLKSGGVSWLAEQMLENARRSLAREPDHTLVAIGGQQPSLDAAIVSYQQARDAARVGRIVPGYGPIVKWDELGVYQTLLKLPLKDISERAMHTGLRRLFEKDDSGELTATLERYLELGCDVKRTATELSLHRASLYYRLHKIEEMADVDLDNGDDRLALHLSLKIAHLTGVHPRRLDRQAAGKIVPLHHARGA